MPYTAPDRGTLRTSIHRDLRDPDGDTFSDAEVNDLIVLAVIEVGRIYPKEDVQELTVDDDYQTVYATDAVSLFRVEVIKEGRVAAGVAYNGESTTGEGGWDLFGGNLYLPHYLSRNLVTDDSPTIRVWGYWPRDVPSDDADVLDGDAEFEYAVRSHAVLAGYQRLQNDRLLFQQWLTSTGNTDVSPNQLAQTVDLYQRQWSETRNRLRRLQRT